MKPEDEDEWMDIEEADTRPVKESNKVSNDLEDEEDVNQSLLKWNNRMSCDPPPANMEVGGDEENWMSLDDVLDKMLKDDDESRSEATFRFKVDRISQMKESILSPPTYVRNLPWRIMVMSRVGNPGAGHPHQQPGKCLGYFLQCNGESESTSWSCHATAELRVIAQTETGEDIRKKIAHIFFSKENDWGFSYFSSWTDIFDPNKGYVRDDTIYFEAWVQSEAPHGVSWDSKKHTGYVGLKNQGATCYMNSLLQTLYFTNKLRKAVYQMPTESDDSTRSVPLALQRVFYDLQFSDKPVGTKKLTKSFGWETLDSFMQHDVQELCRVLLDNMESKMKGTIVEGTIPKLFEGKMISFLRCKHVDFNSSRTEAFYDIQLNIKDKKTIYDSFDDYVQLETLSGENKYDAGDYGLQDAVKGIIFESFPPVLHLHLLRFQYDPLTDMNVKINDRFEFPEKLNLDKYLQKKEETPADYTLHAVLVHSGDNHGGHYVVFINPKGDGKWCKFDDDVVSTCSKSDAIDNNFGGHEMGEEIARHSTNAYMLVYIRDSALADVLQSVTKEDIQEQLVERLQEEKRQEALRRKERSEAHMFLTINAYTEDSLMTHKGVDLINQERTPCISFKVPKSSTVKQAQELIAEQMHYPPNSVRLWPFMMRNNHTYRPSRMPSDEEICVQFAESVNSYSVFLETISPRTPLASLPYTAKESHVLVFFKYYDPLLSILTYCGYLHLPRDVILADILPTLCKMAGLPRTTPLTLFEEEYTEGISRILNVQQPFYMAISELMDGDIIIFQRQDMSPNCKCEFFTAETYFHDLSSRVEITFCDKNNPNDPGFQLNLSLKLNYNQLANAVAMQIGADPYMIQFFKNQSYREGPGCPIRCNFDGTLKDIMMYLKPRQPKKIYYQHLSLKIHELENKRLFKCTYLNSKMKEEELELYPDKKATVEGLLEEAKKSIELPEGSSGKLRLIEIVSTKISYIVPPDIIIECLNPAGTKNYRIEEIPHDQIDLAADEFLVPVAHFQKETYQTYGIPFILKIKHKESFFPSVKDRIQKKLELPDKEYEKYRLTIVAARVQEVTEENNYVFQKEDFQDLNQPSPKTWIGLDHVNKTPKRPSRHFQEKAIKIHN